MQDEKILLELARLILPSSEISTSISLLVIPVILKFSMKPDGNIKRANSNIIFA